VVVHDFDIQRITILPTETDAPLVIDPDAMLSLSIALQGFQTIAWRYTKILYTDGAMKVKQLPSRYPLDIAKPPHVPIIEQRLGISAAE